jgi:hypothetical protein
MDTIKTLKLGHLLFKGSQKREQNPIDTTSFPNVEKTKYKWFTTEHWNAEVYGKFNDGIGSIWIYKIEKELNLLDFSKPQAKNILQNCITNNVQKFSEQYTSGNLYTMFRIKYESIDDLEKKLQFPFGLCSFEKQVEIKYNKTLNIDSQGGASLQRCSFHNYDKLFVFFLDQYLDKSYDGYYAPSLNTIFHGKHFHAELCLFETNKIKTIGRYMLAYDPNESSKIIRAFCAFSDKTDTHKIVDPTNSIVPFNILVYVSKSKNILKSIENAYTKSYNQSTELEELQELQELTESVLKPVHEIFQGETSDSSENENFVYNLNPSKNQLYHSMVTSLITNKRQMDLD